MFLCCRSLNRPNYGTHSFVFPFENWLGIFKRLRHGNDNDNSDGGGGVDFVVGGSNDGTNDDDDSGYNG